jgi:hypothetical protein
MTALTRLSILQNRRLRAHNTNMNKKRPGRKPEVLDPDQLAAAILEAVTGGPVGLQAEPEPDKPVKTRPPSRWAARAV